jgi:hypothetical protein
VKLYRKKNIKELIKVLDIDEYDDTKHRKSLNVTITPNFDFLERNIKGNKILELGCGNGDLFDVLPITHAIEPCSKRFKRAVQNNKVKVIKGCSECIPKLPMMDSVFFIDGFFQVRSLYESLIEINRILRVNGRFIFNFYVSEDQDIVVGVVLEKNNILRILKDFGFESTIECRSTIINYNRFPKPIKNIQICVEKTRNFDFRYLAKPFFYKENKLFEGYNILFERDYALL